MDDLSDKYTLEIEPAQGFTRITVRADEWTPAIAEHYNRQLAERVAAINPERILLIRDIPVTLRLVATFSLMSDFVDGVGRRKVAVVNPYALLKSDLEFVIQVAMNRGEQYRLFDNVAEAELWLMT